MKKLAIIGGGASGLVCSIEAARYSGKAAVISIYEAGQRVGKKLLATGNGRCNLTNSNCGAEFYHGSADFASAVNSAVPPESNLDFFNSIGLYTKTEQGGRVYPLSGQASGVLDALRFASDSLGVKTQCDCRVESIERLRGGFIINGKDYADAVVIASGGMVPATKSECCNTYGLLSSLGHRITPVYPSLVQLVTDGAPVKPLKGLRADVVMSLTASNRLLRRESGELLFTDYGLSGIVSMQLSGEAAKYIAVSGKKPVVYVDFAPSFTNESLCRAIQGIISSMPSLPTEELLSGFMAKRIGQMIIKQCGADLQVPTIGRLHSKDIAMLAASIKSFAFTVTGTRDFRFAQVTAGGADTAQFDPETMQSLIVPGLFCCGEALNVDGDCGGYNLQFAWSSGRLAARGALEYLIN